MKAYYGKETKTVCSATSVTYFMHTCTYIESKCNPGSATRSLLGAKLESTNYRAPNVAINKRRMLKNS